MIADILVYDGTDELDALGPLEVLRSAATMGAEIHARLVTRVAQSHVVGAHGLRFEPDEVLVVGAADVLVVTGGRWIARSEVGAWGEYQRGVLLPVLAEASDAATITAGVCTGTMLLAHAGVVGGRRAATHRSAWSELAATGATLVTDRVVDDGDLVTSGGVTSGIELALWLLEREFSAGLAQAVAERMEYPRARPANASPIHG